MKKRCNVVALPILRDHLNPVIGLFTPITVAIARRFHKMGFQAYHLYIISDDKIEVGDWFVIYLNDKCIKEPNLQSYILKSEGYTEDSTMVRYSDGCKTGFAKKITASTDTSLNLPAIPKWFIEEYAEKQTSEVLVEEKITTGTMIDPNEGWKYGFPKLYCGINPSRSEIKRFLEENGYPMDSYVNCRYWEVEVPQVEIYPIKETWTRDEIEFWLVHDVSLLISVSPSLRVKVVREMLSKLDGVGERYQQFMREVEEDVKADAYKRSFEDFYEGQ